MANWCENYYLIRGPAEAITRYKDSILKDATGKYYPWLSTVPLPELKDEAEVKAYIKKERDNTLFDFHYRAFDMEVIENSPEELELSFISAYTQSTVMCIADLAPKLSILRKYFEPMNCYQGFAHHVKGKMIASGHQDGEPLSSPWQMYDYNPHVSSLEEDLKGHIVITGDQLRQIEEQNENPKKEEE